MDELSALFANKSTSYPGAGLAYSADTRGNGSLSLERGVEVIPRGLPDADTASTDHPFKCPNTADGNITPTTGTINGNIVTGTPSVSSSGTQVVYAVVTMTLTVTAEGYIQDTFATETAWAYGVASSLPSDTTTAVYTTVAVYVDGVLTVQQLNSHMYVRPRDDGTGTTTLAAVWWEA